ncbi:MAG: hypothetical protein IJR94_02115 [Synergistaceae bacterium]|nr:hypothetical protein [Synergistaceae bacterium]
MKLKIFLALALVLALAFSTQAAMLHPDKSGDETLQNLISTSAKKFTVKNFHDEVTGLDLSYDIYLPENYSPEKNFPVVFFIADASAAGKATEFSVTQGYGALVWTEHDAVVIVPTYPEIILDDHNGFKTTDYVELTARFVRHSIKNYKLNPKRVYATGQSMGCMTLLLLASKYPDLFTACLFVSGQWNIKELEGLKTVKFIYAASAGDEKASKGQSEVIKFFDEAGVPYVAYKNIDAKDPRVFIFPSQYANFITFKAGSTLPEGIDSSKNFSEHMSSFDYVYKITALREWLLSQ